MASCCIDGCEAALNGKKYSLFSIPKDAAKRAVWQKAISKEVGPNKHICEMHFEERFIQRHSQMNLKGIRVMVPRIPPKLTLDAAPTIFPNSNNSIKRKLLNIKKEPDDSSLSKRIRKAEELCSFKLGQDGTYKAVDNARFDNVNLNPVVLCVRIDDNKYNNNYSVKDLVLNNRTHAARAASNGPIAINGGNRRVNGNALPNSLTSALDEIAAIDESHLPIIDLVLDDDDDDDDDNNNEADSANGKINNKDHTYNHENAVLGAQQENSVSSSVTVQQRPVRQGRKRINNQDPNVSVGNMCRQLEALRRFKYKYRQLQKKNSILKRIVTDMSDENERLKSSSKLPQNNLPKLQALLIEEALKVNTADPDVKHRFSAEWILYSTILRTQSPTMYSFLKTNEYMPLPSRPTLNTYVKKIEVKYGFDQAVFRALAKKLEFLPHNHRRGALFIREIGTRPDFAFDIPTLGEVYYGDYTDNLDTLIEGDHALVFMFCPYYDIWHQVVGTFCVSGATPTAVLHKLLFQCVAMLDESGAVVESVTCDGVSTHRCVLADLGISGELGAVQCKFSPPSDPGRDIYIIHDVLGIYKSIRNNLIKSKMFKLPTGTVLHSHYMTLFKKEQMLAANAKKVPDLTEAHIFPKPFQKKNFQLVTQLFSCATAEALRYYKEKSNEGLEDIDETINFTQRLAETLAVINAETPDQGIQVNSNSFQIMNDMLLWLDNWENYIQSSGISEYFLSRYTCESLRVTLHSIMELTDKLLKDDFPYVLTSKFRHYALEHYTALVTQDEHPTTVQFFCIHRLLLNSGIVTPNELKNSFNTEVSIQPHTPQPQQQPKAIGSCTIRPLDDSNDVIDFDADEEVLQLNDEHQQVLQQSQGGETLVVQAENGIEQQELEQIVFKALAESNNGAPILASGMPLIITGPLIGMEQGNYHEIVLQTAETVMGNEEMVVEENGIVTFEQQ